MPFEFDTPTVIIIFAAISAIMFAEAVYLLCFSTASYRSNVNRRLKISPTRACSATGCSGSTACCSNPA
jgi:hypothetical protein